VSDPTPNPGDITRLLHSADDGDRLAASRLFDAVYGELRILAQSNMRREANGHTLQPTALVNEAFLRLQPAATGWANRRHFFGAAAEAMRRILVDHARRKHAQKRGDGLERVTLADLDVAAHEPGIEVMALDEALTALRDEDPRLEQVVTLRYFAGLTVEQVAETLELSPATVKRDWTFARAWLQDYMTTRG
jgi:RNA polymerase sigma factor (TIGR02999 family)